MADTHGYETINDRTSGWGPEATTPPTADAAKEVVATRVGRAVEARASVAPADGVEPTWGTNTAMTTTSTEVSVDNRTKDARDTVNLDDATVAKREEAERTSILDRTSGWGHTSGTFTHRND